MGKRRAVLWASILLLLLGISACGEPKMVGQSTEAPSATPTPLRSPTSTSTPPPTPTLIIHVVEPGDTLAGIAALYGITADAICAFNELPDCSLIYPGDELLIPGESVVLPSPTKPAPTSEPSAPTPTPTHTSIPIPTPTPLLLTPTASPVGASDVQIECIFYDGQVYRVESDEYVRITNFGTVAQDLAGWRLQDVSEGYPSLVFPSYILGPGESIRVYTNEHHPEWGGFSFGYGKAVWNNKEPDVTALYNAQGQEVSRRSYPPGC